MLTITTPTITIKDTVSAHGVQPAPLQHSRILKPAMWLWQLIVPAGGVLGALLTGLLNPAEQTVLSVGLGILYFMVGNLAICHINLLTYEALIKRRRLDEVSNTLKPLLHVLLLNTILAGIQAAGWQAAISNTLTFSTNGIGLYISLIVLIALAAFNVYCSLQAGWHQQLATQKWAEAEQQRIKTELKLLNCQLDPHFLFNAMSGVCMFIEKHPQKAQQYVSTLTHLYAQILANKDKLLIPLKVELDICNQYLQLQKNRFGNSITYTLPPQILWHETPVLPPLTLLCLAENAVKHNVFSVQNPLHIAIHITEYCIQMTNNLQPGKLPAMGVGLGLQQLQQRLQLLNFPPASIHLTDTQFSVTILLKKP